MTLEVGDKAPDFTLLSEDETPVSLKDFRGKKVVLYFYPKDNTPGCTREACDFRDQHKAFKKLGVEILGVSKDSAKAHTKFIEKYALPFTLLVDDDAATCKAYGVINKKSMFGKTYLGITRSTFLIDEKGKIQALWRNVKVTGHVEQILNELNS
jgi:thioredoxin-dependent peroxiredoxin